MSHMSLFEPASFSTFTIVRKRIKSKHQVNTKHHHVVDIKVCYLVFLCKKTKDGSPRNHFCVDWPA